MYHYQQKKALENTREFMKTQDLNNPNITGQIWSILNDSNIQTRITAEESMELKDNWSKDLIGELQRELVNYQLHQMKMGNAPRLFSEIRNVFDKVKEGSSILDVGCTSGYYYEIINFYFPNKFNYSGCDYNEQSVNLAKKYYPDVSFFVNDLTDLSLMDRSYDVTFLSGVIEHVPKYETGLSELCRVTKKYIILHRIWLTESSTSCSKGTQYFVPVIRNHYNKKEFFEILSKNGFTVKWESLVYDGNCTTYLLERN